MAFTDDGWRRAADLAEDDVIGLLIRQHARMRELFAAVRTTTGPEQARAFDEVRLLLAVHETAEEEVLRPISERIVGPDVVAERNREEKDAAKALSHLERLGLDDTEFAGSFEAFEATVARHAAAEEAEEFAKVLDEVSEAERKVLGRRLLAVEQVAPTHPHPTLSEASTWTHATVGPFVALVDRVRDALSRDPEEYRESGPTP